ncbi:MAG: hypothetical protein IT406_02115 [Candidatus Yanofskybacteria bacterium]|nr:hypothetical protein [Candidatus Yanofskybacteria bacterium]
MNEFLKRIRERIAGVSGAASTFFRANRVVLLSGVTVLSILLIVWARLGFTFEIGRFFAAEPIPSGYVEIRSAAPGGGVYEFDSQKPGCFGTVFCPNQPPKCNRLGSLAYAVRTGGAKYDTEHNLLFSENPAHVDDYTKWSWATVPTTEADWCNRTDGFLDAWFREHRASPPASGATFWGHIARCIDGTRGYTALTCAKVVGATATATATVTPTSTATATPDVNAPAAGTIAGFCAGGATPSITLRWSKLPPPGSQPIDSNGMNKRVDGVTTQMAELIPVDKGAYWEYVDTRVSPDKMYEYWAKYRPDTRTTNSYIVTTNAASCGGAQTPTVTPTTTVTATPTLSATPAISPGAGNNAQFISQNVPTTMTPGSTAQVSLTFRNSGTTLWNKIGSPGDYGYAFRIKSQNPPDNTMWGIGFVPIPTAPIQPGQDAVFAFSITAPTQPGSYNFQWQMNEGLVGWFGQPSTNVAIQVGAASPAPSSVGLSVSGRNTSTGSAEGSSVSATGGQQVEVIARLSNAATTTGIVRNAVVRAVLPAGISYVPGSTSVNGAPSSVDSIAAGGLEVGALGPGQTATVRFRGSVNGASFPVGQSQVSVNVQATAEGVGAQTGQVAVVVNRAGGQVGTVQTGPGDAVLAALLVSAIITLLYVSYTRSATFKRREVESITGSRDPMDFRS